MQFLKDLLHKHEHHFLKGGKLEKFYPLYEAKESFLFTPRNVTDTSVHVRDSLDSKRLMITVVLALLPCVFFGALNVGYQEAKAAGETITHAQMLINGLITIMPIIITSYAVGGIWEVLFAVTRGHEINEGFLVTGLLFPLTLPPTIPLWQVAMGISFGVVVGKEIFGGTGMNVLNPALTARALLYFSYPVQISGDKVWIVTEAGKTVDGFSGATALSVAAGTDAGKSAGEAMSNFSYSGFDTANLFMGWIPGSIGETSALCILIGAAILILFGVGSWKIMAAVCLGAAVTAGGLNLLAGDGMPGILSMTPVDHLLAGGLLFGAVFMATDPVSAARTEAGKWIYGIMIGILTVLIRAWNPAYPEGAMLAILFMNIFAPAIDHYVVQGNVKRRMNRVAS